MLACESIVLPLSKSEIENLLYTCSFGLEVIASRLTEDGYELILEGDADELSYFLVEAQEVVFQQEKSNI